MTKLKRYFGYTVTSVIPSVFEFPKGDGISGADCIKEVDLAILAWTLVSSLLYFESS